MKREREKNCYAVTKEREKKLNLCIFIARNYNSPDKMLLMQRKSSGNLLGFFFFPCFVYIWSFFPSLCLYCSVSLFFSVSVRFASDFLEIYCLCTVGIARLLM